eukprot:14949-Eustigmatos_ZCMA.PRE.1
MAARGSIKQHHHYICVEDPPERQPVSSYQSSTEITGEELDTDCPTLTLYTSRSDRALTECTL